MSLTVPRALVRVSCKAYSGRRDLPIPKEVDERRMPVAAGGDEPPVPRHTTVVDDRPTPEGRYRAARFVHQKISRRKVPVVAVAAGDGDIESSLGHAGKPQRERR